MNAREADILSILINGDQYGLKIRDEIRHRTGRHMPLGSLYTALNRMVEAGFLTDKRRAPGPKGGNHRRWFHITASGIRARDTYALRAQALLQG
jgi:DNA-binding PadR family transcriptional regulator